MTSTCGSWAAAIREGRYGLASVARMEWVKLRSLRSTWWTLAVTVAGTIAIGTAVGHDTMKGASDITNNGLAGVVPGLLLAGALGVLTMTSEYSSGLIRATLAAVPRRPLVLAGKAVVFGSLALLVGDARRSPRSLPRWPRCDTAYPRPRWASLACCAR